MRVVATAGHVDHGKSSLVLALTGTDPDRLAEEKARGLTIDLGFAFCTLPSGTEVGFVDVPGHVRFIKNMLAGVGAVDVAVFVVAANEGWMPQSEEHLRILDLLGVRDGVVALTKADTVAPDLLELAQLEVEEHLVGSALGAAPVVVCDSVSGRGLNDVRAALDTVLAAAPVPLDHGRPRLWIDRVFSARGAGTVVTGTLAGGRVRVDDELEIARLARAVRVRAIETAHRHVDEVAPGARVALNLAGVDHHAIGRGDAVVRRGDWARVTVADVAVTPVAGATLPRRGRLQAAVGSGEHPVAFRALGADTRFARLRFDSPLPLAPGDRLVLRDPGPDETIGGAEVLDVEPPGRASDAPARLARPLGPRLLAGRGWVALADLPRLTGLDRGAAARLADALDASGDATRAGDWLVERERLDTLRVAARARVAKHHRDTPLEAGIEAGALAGALGVDAAQLRAALADDLVLVVERGVVRDAARRARASESPEGRAVLAELDATPFSPPAPSDAATARALVREGVLVDVDGVLFTAAAVDRAREQLQSALRERGSLTIADVRELLGSSRKYVVPLLGYFDAAGVTRRRGDVRVAGPHTLRRSAG